ncbi:hypothetical protein SteCoe_31417 [Stentor coeruleus]|uniref:non-specific serine/threonine protein kinase n=1 Tax=Stentor coeruleus TaxID=5963 RepID=A0A1R2B1C7_9CILI|nr:hypothetical protein SteCoe_31417 [Stentor coeruleus]
MGCTITTKYRKKSEEIFISNINEIKIDPGLFVNENKKKFQDVYRAAQSLSTGIYGEVKTCFHRETGQKRAVKILKKDLMRSELEKTFLLKEISILKSLDHPNIIRTYEFFEDLKHMYLIMEYCSGGELFTEILKRQNFCEGDAAKIFFQILSAVSYLHSNGVIHGDLSPKNILLEEKKGSLSIKVIDFGSAMLSSEKNKKLPKNGKAYYLAPEVYDGIYNDKSDMWSCGIILYILLCGHPPFDGENDEQIISLVKRSRVQMEGRIWEKISSSAKDFIEKLICGPSSRLTAQNALKHMWFDTKIKSAIEKYHIIEAMQNLREFHAPNILKDAIITFVTSQYASLKETKELREVFLSLDKDGDGKISKEELLEAFKNTIGEIEEIEIERIMGEIDSDNNGFIDYTEFLKANIDTKKLLSDQNLKLAFSIFDTDGSGKISAEEIKKVFLCDQSSDENIWKEIIKSLDVNGDGEIDLEEFKALVKLNYNSM